MEVWSAFKKDIKEVITPLPHFIIALGVIIWLIAFTQYNGKINFPVKMNTPIFIIGTVVFILGVISYFVLDRKPKKLNDLNLYNGFWIYEINIKHQNREKRVFSYMELAPTDKGSYKVYGKNWLPGVVPTSSNCAAIWTGYGGFLDGDRLGIIFSVNSKNDFNVGTIGEPTEYKGLIEIDLNNDLKSLQGSVHDFVPYPSKGYFNGKRPKSRKIEDIILEAYNEYGQI